MPLTLNANEKRELITALITNCGGWDEDDIDLLVNMEDDKLWIHAENCAQLISNADPEDDSGVPDSLRPESSGAQKSDVNDGEDSVTLKEGSQGSGGPPAGTPDTQEKDNPTRCYDDEGNEVECPEDGGEPTANWWSGTMNEEEYIANMPPRLQSVVINALQFEEAQKKQLVSQITANKRNRFSEDYLMSLDTDELQAIAELAGPTRNQIHSTPSMFVPGGPTLNQQDIDREDVLIPPVLEFSFEK